MHILNSYFDILLYSKKKTLTMYSIFRTIAPLGHIIQIPS